MISCAKALSAGMQPISALLINQRVFEAMLDESRKLGNFAHGFTYAGHPVTTAVAMETLRIYEEIDMIGHVQRVGPYMQQALRRFADHPLVGEVRGVGLLCGDRDGGGQGDARSRSIRRARSARWWTGTPASTG